MTYLLNDPDFDWDKDVLHSDTPVLVVFTAQWCPDCRALAPVIDAVQGDGFKVKRVTTDKNHDLVSRYRIRSIPTILVFKLGQETFRHVGSLKKDEIIYQLR